MLFTESEPQISPIDILSAENLVGVPFPQAVKELYIKTNGGIPATYVYEDENVDTVVSELLPIKSDHKTSAIKMYVRLVLEKKLAPKQFLPFAVDGGGDYFFVDCATVDGIVHFCKSDSFGGVRLLNLRLGFLKFWSSLKPE